jgi:uncharacterized membrane protein
MLGLFVGSGLAAAAGLNAFVSLVIISALARFTSLIDLSPGFSWLTSWPAILVLFALLTVELIIDKIPGVDTTNDVFQTPVRPAAAALAFAASSTASSVDGHAFWGDHIWIAWVLGALFGLAAHLSKAASRTAISAATGGAATAAASFAEDGIAVVLCFVALFLPWMVPVLLVAIVALVYWIVTIGRRRRERIKEKQREWRAEREAAEFAAGFRSWLTRRGLLSRTPTRRVGSRARTTGSRPRRTRSR